MTEIKGLHHAAYRCRDSQETRAFYEGFLGLPLVACLELTETKTGRPIACLHTFYRMADGSHIAFFEVPEAPYDFHDWHDFDLHIAVEVEHDFMMKMLERGKAEGREPRGVADHGLIESIYFRDPNGYVVELTAKLPEHDQIMAAAADEVDDVLAQWQAKKPSA